MRHFVFVSAFLVFLVTTSVSRSEPFRPVHSKQFFVPPNSTATLAFSGGEQKPIPFLLKAENGRVVHRGTTELKEGNHVVPAFFPRGFMEVEFPSLSKDQNDPAPRFGVVALPSHPAEKRDPFFCIDGALSWLVGDDRRRQDYIEIAADVGITTIRERLSWTAINRVEGEFHWEADRRYETLRQSIKNAGIDLLEVFHDAPPWVGRIGKLPDNLIKTADAWEAIAKHWEPTWAALEIWNEPDISFSGDMPADQYVPLVKALTWKLKQCGVRSPLLGGSIAHFNRSWMKTAEECGLMECIDGFSFHTYTRAPAMERLVQEVASAVLEKRPETTLWLTECGRPWKRGPERPPRQQDLESACDIVMKGVESKASVVDRYFPFVYPYYDERENNFGMMDKNGSPLRSMGAYVQMIRMLSGYEPFEIKADEAVLPLAGPEPKLVRCFRRGDDAVLVLYSGDTVLPTTVRCKAGRSAESLTGEPLAIADDGTLLFDGGLVYVRIATTNLVPSNETVSIAASLRQKRLEGLEKRGRKPEAETSPIVAVYRFDPDVVEPGKTGYRLKKTPTDRTPLSMRIYNLDEKEHAVFFHPITSAANPTVKEEEKILRIPPKGFVEQTLSVDFRESLAADHAAGIRFCYGFQGVPVEGAPPGQKPCRVELVFFGEPDWTTLRSVFPDALRLPTEEGNRWKKNIAGIGTMEMIHTPPTAAVAEPFPLWTMKATFRDGDRWVYPRFTLPENVDLSQYRGIFFRARCSKGGTTPRLMFFETGGSGYLTADAAFPADGEWHAVRIPFETLEYCAATTPDPNGKLDLNQVRTFSFGANTKEPEITLDVADCYLY